MPVPANLVHQLTTGTGTGNLPLTAVPGKQTFGAAFPAGTANEFDYFISHRGAAEWERGTGTISAGALVRDTVLESSNANAAVNFSAGDKDVTNDIPAADNYRVGGTDVALADGGTGASLADPNADRVMFWDDSAGAVAWGAPGNGLAFSGTTLDTVKSVLRIYTADATWTKPAGLTSVQVWGIGGGGGSEAATAAANQVVAANGGGSGTYGFKEILAASLGSSVAVTIGAAGAPGSTAGTSTSFGSHMTLPGAGSSGTNMASGTSVAIQGGGTQAADATGADWFIRGNFGGRGVRLSGTNGYGGFGATSPLGNPPYNTGPGNNAIPATGYGAGAVGPVSNSTTTRTGSSGSPGILFVLEIY